MPDLDPIPEGQMRVWDADQKKVILVPAPPAGPDMLTLAEMLLPGSNREGNPELTRSALEARAAVFGNNAKSPRIPTDDLGMPQARQRGQRQDWNYAIGNRSGGRPQ